MEIKSSPANAPIKRVSQVDRVPMSLPTPKLSVPDLPGFYLYWHLGKNVGRALKAGYTFVNPEDVEIAQKGVANDAALSGSTDMGTRISVAAGGTVSEDNLEPERLYLMKLPNEFREADVAMQASQNELIAQALRSGDIGGPDPDKNKRYMKQGQDLFFPKARKP